MKRTPSGCEFPTLFTTEHLDNLLRQNDAHQTAGDPATPPRMLVPVSTAADSDIAALKSSRIDDSPATAKKLRAVMSAFVADSPPPGARQQALQASTPVFLLPRTSIASGTCPDWPGNVWSNRDGTYQLSISGTDPRIAEIVAVLGAQSSISRFKYIIHSTTGPSIPGLHEVCEGLRQNRGLQVLLVMHFIPTPRIANPDDLFLICDAVHDHPALNELKLPPGLLIHGAALNKELTHPRSKLKELSIMLPECQQQLDAFAESLANNLGLINLTLNLTARSAPNHERLATALAMHPALTTLSLYFNGAASDGRTLFGSLTAARSLRDLTVEGIGDRQAQGLRDFLAGSQGVQRMRLNCPRLSTEGCALVVAGLDRNLSITNPEILSMRWKNEISCAKVDTQIARAIGRARVRNTLLQQKSALVGDAISARMSLDRSTTGLPALPPDVGALIAEAVALHLPTGQAQSVYRALWPE